MLNIVNMTTSDSETRLSDRISNSCNLGLFTFVTQRKRSKSNGGFTLVELLTVMVIIAILLGIIIGIAMYAQRAAYEAKARAQIEQISNALQEYHVTYFTYPDDASFATAIVPFLGSWTNIPLDPWKVPYQYQKVGNQQYILFSCGYDKLEKTPDDISTGN